MTIPATTLVKKMRAKSAEVKAGSLNNLARQTALIKAVQDGTTSRRILREIIPVPSAHGRWHVN